MGKVGAVEEKEGEKKWEVALSCPIFVHVEASAMEVVEEVGMNTVYTPAPPPAAVVEDGKPVMYVPGGTPGPVMALPTPNAPLPTALTVRVVPDRVATTPVAARVAAAAGEEATVCVGGAATVYVPKPVVGDTLSTPVTTVPGTTPGPDTGVPTASRVGDVEVEEDCRRKKPQQKPK
jgi:hypothetical protein